MRGSVLAALPVLILLGAASTGALADESSDLCKRQAADERAKCLIAIADDVRDCQQSCTNDNSRVECERHCQDTEHAERNECFDKEDKACN